MWLTIVDFQLYLLVRLPPELHLIQVCLFQLFPSTNFLTSPEGHLLPAEATSTSWR